MMKKLMFLLIVFVCVALINDVSAAQKLQCEYLSMHSDDMYRISIMINGDVIDEEVIFIKKNESTEEFNEYNQTSIFKGNVLIFGDVSVNENSELVCPLWISVEKDKIVVGATGDNVFSYIHGSQINENIGASQCFNYKSPTACDRSLITGKVACVWVDDENAAGDEGGYCNVDNLQYVGCGGASDIPVQVPSLISLLVNLLKIATPIILIFISIVTLLKALAAQKEDEIKKAQSSLIKKLIAAAMVFFIIAIVQFVISKVAANDEEYEGFTDCLDCFLNNECSNSTYYKTVSMGMEFCTPLTTGETVTCAEIFNK